MASGAFVSNGRRRVLSTSKSLTITEKGKHMSKNGMRPVHPGEILREDYLVPLEMSVNALALALNVPATRMHEIVKERRGITADTAYRLARYFDSTPEFWLNLQAMYDLKTLPTRSEIDRKVEPRESVRT